MAYLQEIDLFRGDGSRNEKGQTLEEFLEKYNAKKYDCPSNTVDMILFGCGEPYRSSRQLLKLLMIRRRNHPSIGFWALPGGFVELREDLRTAAARELQEETGLTDVPMVQLKTWGDPDRDPRWRVITTTFLAITEGELPAKAGDDAADAAWLDVALRETQAEESGEAAPGQTAAEDQVKTYLLELDQAEKDIHLSALVRRTLRKRGILTEEEYQLCENRGIAVHHAEMIVDAILYLQRQADDSKSF